MFCMSVPRIRQKPDSCKIECSLWKADIFRFRISVPIFAVAKLVCDILAALCYLPASPERVRCSHSFGWVCPTKASVPVPLGRMWHSHTGGRTWIGFVHRVTFRMSVPRIGLLPDSCKMSFYKKKESRRPLAPNGHLSVWRDEHTERYSLKKA